jgi:DNA-binding NarL/FixJ family response regulator
MPVRVLIADDHQLVLNGIRSALAHLDDMEIVGETRRGSQVLPLVKQLHPDAVILDIRMPEMDGLACLELLRKRHPEVRVIMLSVYNDAERIESALRRGASGYIVKSIGPADLGAAVRNAIDGTVFHAFASPTGAGQGSDATDAGLTERELAILRAVARGLSNRAIGRELWVTEQTVKFHLTNVYRKLGVANRTEAARAAFRLGVAESPVVESR